MDMADWNGVPLRRLLDSAECLSEAAIFRALAILKTPASRSRALLWRVTSPDQYRVFAFVCLGMGAVISRPPLTLMGSLEILHGALWFGGRGAEAKGPKIPSAPGLWIRFPGVGAVLAGFKFPNH